MARGRIVVFGSCNMDMYVVTDRLPAPGETVVGGDFRTRPGGKGANQAVAAARAGSEVAFLARLGNDLFGRELTANLQKERVSVDYIELDRKNRTGVAMIMIDSDGENIIAVAPGANALLDTTQAERARNRVEAADYVLLQMEIPRETVEYAVNMAYRENAAVMLNAAPAPSEPLSSELLSKVDVLVVNESEAKALSGVEVTDESSAEEAAKALRDAGASKVVLTLGAKGALAAAGETTFVKARQIKAVDTVGAGDAFCGALVTALSEGMEFVESVNFASAAAALACSEVGAQAALPSRTDIESFYRG